MSMDIYAKEGTKVRVLFNENGIMNGTDSDKEHAEKYLTETIIYTIDHTEVSSWHTSVFLKELPGIPFNSVHFEEMKPPHVSPQNTATEEQEIADDNNELIALFLGYIKHKEGYFINEVGNFRFVLSYNSIWSELMDVWYKFRGLRFFEGEHSIHDEFKHSEFRQNIAHQICYGTIESAYQAIVSGIQWYNSIK